MKGDAILLERRAPTGIWGGLWCLPQIGAMSSSKLPDEQRLLSEAKVDGFEHSFTHFKMSAQVFEKFVVNEVRLDSVRELTHRWVKLSDLAEYGLPAPIKAYLTDLVLRT
jgi:A/G-specific adenine glycosylase